MATKLTDSAGQPLSLMHVWNYSEMQHPLERMVTREIKLLQGDRNHEDLYCLVNCSEEPSSKGRRIDLDGMDVESRINQLKGCEVVLTQNFPVFTDKFLQWDDSNTKLIQADGSLKWQVVTGKRTVQIPFAEMSLDVDLTGFSKDLKRKISKDNIPLLEPDTIFNLFQHRVTVYQVKVNHAKSSFTLGVRTLRFDTLLKSGLSWKSDKDTVDLKLQNGKWKWTLNNKKADFLYFHSLSLQAPVLRGFSQLRGNRQLALLDGTDVSVRDRKIYVKPISSPSRIDSDLKVSPYQWAVTVVTNKRVYPCAEHAEIIVEGINDGYFSEVKPGQYFLLLAHFKGNFRDKNEDIEIKLCGSDDDFNYLKRSFVWKRSSKSVQRMLDKIKEKKQQGVDFARCGGKTLFSKEGEENCWTFIYDVLPEAHIYPSTTFTIQNYLFDHFFHVMELNDWRNFSDEKGRKVDRRKLATSLSGAKKRIDDWTKDKKGVVLNNRSLLKFMKIIELINLESVQKNGGSDDTNPLFKVATKYTKKKDFFSQMSLEGLEEYKKLIDKLL